MFKKIYRGTPKGGSVEKQIMAYTEIKYEERKSSAENFRGNNVIMTIDKTEFQCKNQKISFISIFSIFKIKVRVITANR